MHRLHVQAQGALPDGGYLPVGPCHFGLSAEAFWEKGTIKWLNLRINFILIALFTEKCRRNSFTE